MVRRKPLRGVLWGNAWVELGAAGGADQGGAGPDIRDSGGHAHRLGEECVLLGVPVSREELRGPAYGW